MGGVGAWRMNTTTHGTQHPRMEACHANAMSWHVRRRDRGRGRGRGRGRVVVVSYIHVYLDGLCCAATRGVFHIVVDQAPVFKEGVESTNEKRGR